MPTYIIISCTLDTETIICMMNKNLPAYLWYTLKEQGFPEDFIMDILKKSCKAATVADQFKYKWDEENKSLISEKDKE
jgi:hypothetical protein